MSKLCIFTLFNLNAEYGQWRGQGALCPGQRISPRVASGSSDGREPSTPGHPPTSAPDFPGTPSPWLQQGLCLSPWTAWWSTPNSWWRFTHSTRTSSGTTRVPDISSSYVEQLKGMSLLVRAWQNVVHWRTEWQTTSSFLLWEPHEQYEKVKRYDTERWAPEVSRCPIYYWGWVEGNY